jgi:hypothetical protein
MVAGQYPKREWKDNPDGRIRTIQEAVSIAKRYGVEIPDDLEFHVDESGELDPSCTARSPRVDKPAGESVFWSDLVHDKTHKVPFRIWPGILKSDEAIVADFAHEMVEISWLWPHIEKGRMTIDDYIMHTEPGRPGSLQDRAWDHADRMVDKMREGPPQ